jgi:long-chain fatty acid transport protein
VAARWRRTAQAETPGRSARRERALFAASAFLTALAGCPRAHASGFATARFGGEHGNVTEANPMALYYNVGALGFSEGFHGMVDGSLALRSLRWVHPPASSEPPEPPGAEGANSGKAELFNVFGAPALGASARFGNWAFGAGLFAPFGGRATWSRNPSFVGSTTYPLAADGVQRWHSIRGALTFLYASAGAAYRIGPLSLGASGNLVSASVHSLRAYNPSGTTLPDVDQEGRTELDFDHIVGSFGVGALFEAIEARLWLGASYQAQPSLGAMKLPGTLVVTYGGVQRTDEVELTQALPDIVRLGARYRPSPETELRLFGDVTRWSLMRTQCVALAGYPCVVTPSGADPGGGGIFANVRRYWNDTFSLRAGASRWFRPELELFLGAGFETAATPDETLDPELPDSATVQGALGARWQFLTGFFLAGSYTHLYYLPRDNIGKSEKSDADIPTRRPDGGGEYKQWVGVFNANVEMVF